MVTDSKWHYGCVRVAMRFEWDHAKNESNLLKHKLRFETAVLVFDDPFALTQRDELSERRGTLDHPWIGPS